MGAKAQDSLKVLDPVTVSATISPAQSSKTGRNILVIQGEQFAKLPVSSIDEFLRYVPGIEVQARGPMGAQSDILIRGSTFQQVLILIDGIRLNDPLTGHFNSYMPVTPSEIERIEVLKGASSAIYGTESVGGVIHIITKAYARNVKSSQAEAQVAVGQYGLIKANAGGLFTDGRNTITAGLLTNHATGQQQRGTRGGFDLTTGSLGFSRSLNPHWNLALQSSYDSRSFSAQNFYTSFGSDTATETVKTWWNQAQLQYHREGFKWNTRLSYKQVSDHYVFNRNSVANDNRSQVVQAMSTIDKALNSQAGFTTGIQYIQRNIESNDRGTHAVSQVAAFLLYRQQIGNHLFIDPAIRFDYHERGGFEFVPQLNASFRHEIFQLRGSIGRTIRDADFTERFNNYNKTLVASGRIGNPDLEAEKSWSYELGGDLYLKEYLKISATWFERDQEKLIDWITTPYADMPRKSNLSPNGTYALAKNISKVKTTGFETDIQFSKRMGLKNKLTANAGLLWLTSKLPNGATPGFYLSAHANFMTNFSVNLELNRLLISFNGLYKIRSAQEAPAIQAKVSPDYFVANARVEIRVIKQAGIFIQMDNLADTKYSDLLGTPMPGRWLMGGIRFNWP